MKELFRVERATDRDREALKELLVAQLREHRIETSPDHAQIAIDGVLAIPSRGRLLVARDEGGVIGFAYVAFLWALEHGGRSARLEELYVVPERRSGGVGTALVHAAICVARADRCAALDAEIERGHERVEHLYEREGFVPHTRTRWIKLL